mmetsp:Transcript_50807/g.99334  ORF Transcript_50807/g.99334 Transcript_50807/m.99334 type:complete len:210 (-) Transcript_50807:218-847(-)
MWKPGDARPTVSPPASVDGGTPAIGKKRRASVGDKASPDKERKVPRRLSGSVMNLRFMMRGVGGSVPATPPPGVHPPPAAVYGETDATMTSNDGPQGPATPTATDCDGRLICPAASDADMYGPSVCLVGRRSFGNFNSHAESTYRRALGEVGLSSDLVSPAVPERSRDDGKKKRYPNQSGALQQGAPVGNLQKKLKRTTSISQQKERGR